MIQEYIIQHIKSKLQGRQSLVLYDAERIYEALLKEFSGTGIAIFNISENILSTREDALDYYCEQLPKDTNARMMVYVPYAAPQTKQEKIDDPFFTFTLGGNFFPFDSNDKYESLCKACFKDKEEKISELFAQEIPSFETINALGGGNSWAKLQTITGCKSDREILAALMAPNEDQAQQLNNDKTWQKEYKEFAKTIGLEPKAKTYNEIQYELWRFVLFSEFVFDLPVDLPASLKTIPLAKGIAKQSIIDLCKRLRNDKTTEEIYVEQAEKIARELRLAELFRNEVNLGEIITFSFEDNTYLSQCVEKILESKLTEAERYLTNNKDNIWIHHDADRRKYWKLVELAIAIVKIAQGQTTKSSSLKKLIDFYTQDGHLIDRYQRNFEGTNQEIIQPNESIRLLVGHVRNEYRRHSESLQKNYIELIREEKWPVSGFHNNIDTFSKVIQPLLKSHTKAAYILVDALRFELGKNLEELLAKHYQIETKVSCAYLPTITPYGMAALLPEAEKQLHLEESGGALVAMMGDQALLNLSHRKEYLKEKLGDHCSIISLDGLLTNHQFEEKELLVVTTNEIDNAGENLANKSLPSIQMALQNLHKAVYELFQKGFEKIVLATDHGFVLHPDFVIGDNAPKPQGEWILTKSRCLAGRGNISADTLSFSPDQIGIKSKVERFLFLKNYAVFEKNTHYFHEGLSLQENILPVMLISKSGEKNDFEVEVTVTYKGKTSGAITTRRPSFEVSSYAIGKLIFEPITIRIEALSLEKVVGAPASSIHVVESSKFVEIVPGKSIKVPFEMNSDFEGSFEIRITDPVTNKLFSSIILQTDYIS